MRSSRGLVLKAVSFKTLTTELGERTCARLPSVQMALALPARGNEATGDMRQGQGRGRQEGRPSPVWRDGTVRKQLTTRSREAAGSLCPSPGAAPAPAGNRRAHRSQASWAPTQNPRCLLQAPQAPERLRGSWFQSRIFTIFQVPAVPLRGDRSRQSQRRAGCRLQAARTGPLSVLPPPQAAAHSSQVFRGSLWPSGTGHNSGLGRRD